MRTVQRKCPKKWIEKVKRLWEGYDERRFEKSRGYNKGGYGYERGMPSFYAVYFLDEMRYDFYVFLEDALEDMEGHPCTHIEAYSFSFAYKWATGITEYILEQRRQKAAQATGIQQEMVEVEKEEVKENEVKKDEAVKTESKPGDNQEQESVQDSPPTFFAVFYYRAGIVVLYKSSYDAIQESMNDTENFRKIVHSMEEAKAWMERISPLKMNGHCLSSSGKEIRYIEK